MLQDYHVKPIDKKIAIDIVIQNHYLHRKPPCSISLGLFHNEDIVGVITYGVPPSHTLLKGICGEDESQNVYELNRLWVSDSVPKNGESFFISQSFKFLDKEIIVSFADTSQNHVGIVYQATNWIYTGMSAKFKDPKVRGLEHMHHATYANRMTNKELIDKFGEDNVYFVDRPRKHRYIYFNANKRKRKELMKKLKYKQLDYPKIEKQGRMLPPVELGFLPRQSI